VANDFDLDLIYAKIMIDWLIKNGFLLVIAIACSAYFAFYVMLARERQNEAGTPRRRHEKDC
jgi:hypothetical protein